MVDNMQTLLKVLTVLSASILLASAQVPELNERFLDVYKNGKWLIEFYAPWCGHCKKLEPIYNQVHHQLKNTDVHVAKIDATRFSVVASQFEVRGFPTIKFIHGEKVHTFRGERTRDEIVEFVNKARGPAVRHLSSIGKLNEAKSQHSDDVFFLFIGDEDPSADLYSKYATVADEQMALTYFYAGSKNILPQDITIKKSPTLLVFKDRAYYEYEAPKGIATMSSVQRWIKGERYPAFPLVSGPNINEMADTGKFLVIFVIEWPNNKKKKSQSLMTWQRVVTTWNSLPNEVINAKSVKDFEAKLDRFWRGQPMKFHFEEDLADATGSGGPTPNMNLEIEADKVATPASVR